MQVTAMMVCEKKQEKPEEGRAGNVGDVHLRCVTDPEGEYAQFFKYTPYGTANLGILNAAAFAQFEEGATYRVTFTKVEKAVAG